MRYDFSVQARPDEYSEYFAARRPSSVGERIHRFWNRRMLTLAGRFIPGLASASILEVGPGLGFFAGVCRERKLRWRGVEMNHAQAQALQAQGFEVDAGAIPPFPPGPPVDVIWMSHVLEHAPGYRDAFAMVSAAKERLEPGGRLVVIGPDVLSWRGEFWNCDWTHGFPTSLRRVEQLFGEAGLRVETARHHTATVATRGVATLLGWILAAVPHNLLDALFTRLTGRTFAYAFMVLFGWRQILVVGRKPLTVS